MMHFDGIFSELGYAMPQVALQALLTVNKPNVMWNAGCCAPPRGREGLWPLTDKPASAGPCRPERHACRWDEAAYALPRAAAVIRREGRQEQRCGAAVAVRIGQLEAAN